MKTNTNLPAPFVYPGGKSMIASQVWECFGNKVGCYVEPFFGSGAVLLNRPVVRGKEIINDLDDMICNFWRAVRKDPDAVARYADWPIIESDKHARHHWLLERRRSGETLRKRLEGDVDYCEIKTAGYWVWVMSVGIGSKMLRGTGPWVVEKKGKHKELVRIRRAGVGIDRQIPGLKYQTILGTGNISVHDWFKRLSDRLKNVIVCCGDWKRVCGGSSGDALSSHLASCGTDGVCAVFLDPPYSTDANYKTTYTHGDQKLAVDVREWARKVGKSKKFWIIMCGYEGEHNSLCDSGWKVLEWKAQGGWSRVAKQHTQAKENSSRERLWLSPHCGKKIGFKF